MAVKPQKLQRAKNIAMCIFGMPGAGKTRLLGSANSVLIVRPPTDHTDAITNPKAEELVAHDHSELLEIFQWGQQGGFDAYEWVGLDGISLLEDHGLDDVFQAAIDRKPDRAEYGPDKGEYGVNRHRLTKNLRDMVGLAKDGHFNFLVTANVMEWYDPVREEDIWMPAYGSKKTNLSLKMCGMMNIVAYMAAIEEEGKDRKEVLTIDSEGFAGKDQLNCFPKLKSGRHGFINPTMSDIEAAIKKARGSGGRKSPSKTTTNRRRSRRRS